MFLSSKIVAWIILTGAAQGLFLATLLTARKHNRRANLALALLLGQFVNDYRVQAARRALEGSASAEATLLEVAYDVGFGSKSAFNAAFKKRTGVTPSEYRRRSGAA